MQDDPSTDFQQPDDVQESSLSLTNGHAIKEETAQPDGVKETTETSSHDPPNPQPVKDDVQAPPRKRRRLDILNPRHVSPPWKEVKAEGPTSFTVDGRRKSSRTNALPLDLQPRGAKVQTRRSFQNLRAHIKPSNESALGPEAPRRPGKPGRPPKAFREGGKHAPHRVTKATRHVSSGRSSRVNGDTQDLKNFSTGYKKTRELREARVEHRLSRNSSRRHSVRRIYQDRADEFVPVQEPHTPPSQKKPLQDSPSHPPLFKLTFRRPPLPVVNPRHLVGPRKFESLEAWLQHDDPLEGEDGSRLSDAQARGLARMRNRVEAALRPGGALSEDRLEARNVVPQPEPRQYGHYDQLLEHIKDFQPRLDRERREHLAMARKLAHAAAARWREKHKSPEDIEREARKQLRLRFKLLHKELQKTWEHAVVEAKKIKMAMWQEQEQERGTRELDNILEKKRQLLLERQKGLFTTAGSDDEGASANDDEDASQDGNNTASEDSSDESSADDDDMSDTSESSHGTAGTGPDKDADLTIDELRQKYQNVPSELASPGDELTIHTPRHRGSSLAGLLGLDDSAVDTSEAGADDDMEEASAGEDGDLTVQAPNGSAVHVSQVELDEVADDLLDDDEFDSESGTEQSESDEDDGSEGDSGEDDDDVGLMGFFSKPSWNAMAKVEQEQDSEIDVEETTSMADVSRPQDQNQPGERQAHRQQPPAGSQASTDANVASTAPSDQISANHNSDAQSPAESSTSVEKVERDGSQSPQALAPLRQVPKLAVPELLRGTLREYQHYGLEWLAGLYANNTNGILADEMGLGKTIQTIALLAHLAVHHHNWGPHLIVVPTSVILNWYMEFKRWCPGFKVLAYYGTQKERDAKRKGWSDDGAWNVCITSYQLALQDVKSLKRKNWHYMVLDEAHNIKNFRSKRWETLLTFKTEARLLLTGTPLQNNLTELWSLLFFISPGDERVDGTSFSDLEDFNRMFKRPADAILDYGLEGMDDTAREIVAKLHQVLRPHLLRRLKQDVEKQMPPKYEHIVPCRLSKRQRQLYDGYMRRADTRQQLASGNYMSMINVLMQLRKVCNHPNLFETRPIVTSFAMRKSAVADFEIKSLLVRKRLLECEDSTPSRLSLFDLTTFEHVSKHEASQRITLAAERPLHALVEIQRHRIDSTTSVDASGLDASFAALEASNRRQRLTKLSNVCQFTALQSLLSRGPIYGRTLLETLDIHTNICVPKSAVKPWLMSDTYLNSSSLLAGSVLNVNQRADLMHTAVQKFACVTPAVVAPGLTELTLNETLIEKGRQAGASGVADAFHEARVRLSIAFPDKGLIQYDCGKLQRLAMLLRDLERGGHRALIFTQMTKVLDILEEFLNFHGYRYLRLDGQTKLEQRQLMTDRFNNDPKIPVMILSSRSGGLGINLTGADSVIFYDLDWNPAMDKQCQDRCHRIGQTREVHIYRFVSQGTIEANILRKSNQKRMLDDVFIQEGQFTTEYFNNMDLDNMLHGAGEEDGDAEAGAALDKVLGEPESRAVRLLEAAEDQEDAAAARIAQAEAVQNEDAADFDERVLQAEGASPTAAGPSDSTAAGTPHTTGAPATPVDRSSHPSTPSALQHTFTAPPAPPAPPTAAAAATPTPTTTTSSSLTDWTGVSISTRLLESFDERDARQDDPARQLLAAWLIPMCLWELRNVIVLPPGAEKASWNAKAKAKAKAKRGGMKRDVPRIRR